jgi:hypothetical protein
MFVLDKGGISLSLSLSLIPAFLDYMDLLNDGVEAIFNVICVPEQGLISLSLSHTLSVFLPLNSLFQLHEGEFVFVFHWGLISRSQLS